MTSARDGRCGRGAGRSVHRGTPLAAALTAIALTVAVFPDALHSSVAGPGPQGAVQPHAQASVTHEGDVPPLSLGQSGAGADGSGAGTGRPAAVRFGGQAGGLGAGSNPGFGAGAGVGPGVGAGSGSGPGGGTGSSSPTPTPPASGSQPTQTPPPPSLPPPPTSCSSCQGGQGTPVTSLCYSNSLGPDSQTTEDPLSPPCVPAWDGTRDNGGATSPGITGHDDPRCPDCIVVVVINGDPTVDYNAPATPADLGFYPHVLRQFFQSHFQTYGRTVMLYGFHNKQYNPGYLTGAALANAVVSQYHPFAVIQLWQSAQPNTHDTGTTDPNPYFARMGVEYFDYFLAPDWYLPDKFLDQDTVIGGVPYYWSFDPTVEDVLASGASWVCRSIAARPVTQSGQFAGMPRRIALGYDSDPNVRVPGAGGVELARQLVQQFEDLTYRDCPNLRDPNSQDGDSIFVEHLQLWDDKVGDTPLDPGLAKLRQDGVTSIVCLFCSENGSSTDQFAQAEASAQYLPEFLFVAGELSDPYIAQRHNQTAFNGAFGIQHLWQVPAQEQTYWYRAVRTVDPTLLNWPTSGMYTYESMMQLYSAIQLAGPTLTPATIAQGLLSWQRSFLPSDPTGLQPGGRPAAGYSPSHHAFLRGMIEERWDSSARPPGVRDQSDGNTGIEGCYRILDGGSRYDPGTWPSGSTGDHSGEPNADAPCTGIYDGQ